MCIDGTAKTTEETDDRYESGPGNAGIENIQAATSTFPEISGVNGNLLEKEIPCLFIAVKKEKKGHIKQLHEQLASMPELATVKMILYVEHTVDVNDLPSALWRFCNNLDPKRDHHLFKLDLPNGKYRACMGFDGTRKTKEFDDFHRDWPNIIVADQETIEAVDAKWDQLGLGEFITSPSLKFKSQMYGEEAIVNT
jgi:4-hydroxy-3-polyprenylbenzoate decarboxylase